ncbi:Uncharacterised protein at_DN1623 [Pycnogonum litorale]
MLISQHNVKFQLDSGATLSVLVPQQEKLLPCAHELIMYNKTVVEPSGIVPLLLHFISKDTRYNDERMRTPCVSTGKWRNISTVGRKCGILRYTKMPKLVRIKPCSYMDSCVKKWAVPKVYTYNINI